MTRTDMARTRVPPGDGPGAPLADGRGSISRSVGGRRISSGPHLR
jgi:hypothetical protein